MFIALNESNQPITAEQIDKERSKERKNTYYCPACHEAVFLKSGTYIHPHFAHYAQHNCHVFSEGETTEHLIGKKLLFNWFIQQGIPCQMEAYLPNLQQRPDLLIWLEPDRPIAIEFQCSSLSTDKMIERTEGYLQNGYNVFWIAGEKFQLKKSITAFQRLFLKQHSQLGLYYLFLDQKAERLTICFQINCQQPAGYCHYQTYSIDLKEPSVSLKKVTAFASLQNKERTNSFSYLKSHDYLVRGRLYQNPKMIDFQKYIYYHGDSLISLPREVYFPVSDEWLIQTIPHFWKYKILEWIRDLGIGNIFTKKEFNIKIRLMLQQKDIQFYPTPFLTDKRKKSILFCYLTLLTEQNLISAISSNEWVILNLPHTYLNEREKITDFEQLDAKKAEKWITP